MLLRKEHIKQQRLSKGWTQGQFAELCDVSIRTIQRTEKSGVASLETTTAMAAVFDVTVESLLAIEGIVEEKRQYTFSSVYVGFLLAFLVGVLVGYWGNS